MKKNGLDFLIQQLQNVGVDDLRDLGKEALKRGKWQEAIEHFSKAIELGSNYRDLHILYCNRSVAYFRKGDEAKALYDAKQCIQLNPLYIKGYVRAATVLCFQQQYERAAGYYELAVLRDPDNQELLEDYQMCQAKLKQQQTGNNVDLDQWWRSKMLLKNPVVPLKCEVMPGMNTPHEDVDFNVEWDKMKMAGDDRANDGHSFSAPFEDGYTERIYASDLVARAHECAAAAFHKPTREERIKVALQALSITPLCSEAYNILAEEAESLEEALSYYQQGASIGWYCASEATKKKAMSRKDMYIYHSLRPSHRCKHGVANTLRKLGNYEESLKEYLELCSWDTPFPHISTYCNFRYNIPEVYLGLKKYNELDKFLKDNKQAMLLHSATAVYHFMQVLLEYIRNKTVSMDTLGLAFGSSPKVAGYLLGYKPLPNKPDLLHIGSQNTVTNAVTFVRQYKKHFDNIPGLIAYLKAQYLTICTTELSSCAVKGDLSAIRSLLEEHPLVPITSYNTNGNSLLHDASHHGHLNVVHYVLKLGADVNQYSTNSYKLTPLHMACYNGHKDIAQILIKHSADVRAVDSFGMMPIHMSCNQGEHTVVDYLLTHDPSLLEEVCVQSGTPLLSCFGSVHGCITGGRKCQRCIRNNLSTPHSPNCSPTATVDLLVNKYHANVNAVDPSDGTNILHKAVICDMYDCLRIVLKKVDINLFHQLDKQGDSPLDVAAKADLFYFTVLSNFVKDSNIAIPENKPSNESFSKCFNCGIPETQDLKLLVCSACKMAFYCSRDCQKIHWKAHKGTCKKSGQ